MRQSGKKRGRSFLLLAGACALLCGCGYGKDTGPKHPRAKEQFLPVIARFEMQMEKCIGNAVQVNLNREITAEELNNKPLIKKAVTALSKELQQCLTGRGYGNEVQIEINHVEGWLAKTSCPEFAKAVFTSARCNVLQMVLADNGFPEKAPASARKPPPAQPPAQPPAKKRPRTFTNPK